MISTGVCQHESNFSVLISISDFLHGKFHMVSADPSAALPLMVSQKLWPVRGHDDTITMPNVKAYAPLAQLCNVPRARQRIVLVRYFAWDSPGLRLPQAMRNFAAEPANSMKHSTARISTRTMLVSM